MECPLCIALLSDSLERPIHPHHDCAKHFRTIKMTPEMIYEFHRLLRIHLYIPPFYLECRHLCILLVEAGLVKKTFKSPLALAKIWFNIKFYEIGNILEAHYLHTGHFDWKAAGGLSQLDTAIVKQSCSHSCARST